MTEDIYKINCLGLKCPLPVMRLEKAVNAGHSSVELITDDDVSVVDVPLAIMRLDGKLIGQSQKNGQYIFTMSFDKNKL